MGAGRPAAPSRAAICGHPERHRRRAVESRHRPAPRRALRCAHRVGRAREPRGAARAHGPRATPDAPLFGVVSRLLVAEGHGPRARRAAGDRRRRRAARGARQRRPGARRRIRRRGAAHPGRVAAHLGYDEDLAHLMQAGADADPRAVALRAVRPHADVRAALRRAAGVSRMSEAWPTPSSTRTTRRSRQASRPAFSFRRSPASSSRSRSSRTLALWKDPVRWRRLQARAMATDVSWRQPAKQYARLYRDRWCGAIVGPHLRAAISSPSDHAWNGQPRGVCGASPSAISNRCPRPAIAERARRAARRTASRASRASRRVVAVDAQPRVDERADEPRPHRALVIGAVALRRRRLRSARDTRDRAARAMRRPIGVTSSRSTVATIARASVAVDRRQAAGRRPRRSGSDGRSRRRGRPRGRRRRRRRGIAGRRSRSARETPPARGPPCAV